MLYHDVTNDGLWEYVMALREFCIIDEHQCNDFWWTILDRQRHMGRYTTSEEWWDTMYIIQPTEVNAYAAE